MPFSYSYGRRRDGELGVPARRLRPALLLPSTAGYFSATKQECVGNSSGVASEMRVFLRASQAPLTITLPANDGGHGVSAIAYCVAETRDQRLTPGDRVSVSPIERKPPACIREPENRSETEHESERRNGECEAQQNATLDSYRTARRPAWEEE